jgi:hypothetical protein
MSQKARVSHRHTARHAATLTMIDETRHAASTVDLSHGGVSLQTDCQIKLAQYCAVSFQVRLDDTSHNVLAMGQVVYSDPDPELGFKTGVQFLRIDDGSVDVINRLLQAPTPSTP